MQDVRAFAPGRVEILGNHTDYNEGYVLSMAINYGTTAHAVLRADRNLRFRSDQSDDAVMLPLEHGISRTETWADYALGVTKEFADQGLVLEGCDFSYSSDLPVGVGLSSSAALEVSTALALSALFGASMDKLQTARLCRAAENRFVGVNCGLLDQVSSLFGKENHLLLLDCRTEEVEAVFMPPEFSWLVVPSGVTHALIGGEYNERRGQCHEAARILGVPALRDAKMAALGSAALPDVVRRRAMHVIGENLRVREGVDFLRRGAWRDFGARMFDSHESSRHNFENSAPELDQLVDIARKIPGVLGARLTGGGFGGAVLCLVESGHAAEASRRIASQYKEHSGHDTTPLLCQPGEGARCLSS